MRKLIYFPIASLMAVTGKSRPQFATLLTFGHPRK